MSSPAHASFISEIELESKSSPEAGAGEAVRIRRSNGDAEWVSPKELELLEKNHGLARRVEKLRQDRNAALAVALVGAILGVFGLVELLREPPPAVGIEARAMASRAVAPRAPVSSRESTRVVQPAENVVTFVPDRATGKDRQGIEHTVRSWADAWTRQDVDEYLSHYSRGFRDSEGLPRAQWEIERRARIESPGFVRVSIEDLEMTVTSSDSALARFVQAYHSPGYRDRVGKTLELVRERGGWKIVREIVVGSPAAS